MPHDLKEVIVHAKDSQLFPPGKGIKISSSWQYQI